MYENLMKDQCFMGGETAHESQGFTCISKIILELFVLMWTDPLPALQLAYSFISKYFRAENVTGVFNSEVGDLKV